MKTAPLFLSALLASLPALAASPIDGTWKGAPSQATLSPKPYEYLLTDGVFHCYSCVPPLTVAADGQDHAVANDPDIDTANVRVVDARRTERSLMKGGQKVASSSFRVSADGRAAVGEFTSYVGVGPAGPVTIKFDYVRLKSGPKGAHAMSGSWRQSAMIEASEAQMLVTYKLEGDRLKMTTPLGQSFSAPIDGTEVKYVGDPYTDTVTVRRIDARTFEETDMRAGKATSITRMSVSADGKSLTGKYRDLVYGRDGEQVLIRQ